MEDKLGKDEQKKKKFTLSHREKIRFPFLRISCSLARGRREIKENGRIVLFIVKYLSYYKFYQALLKRIIFFFFHQLSLSICKLKIVLNRAHVFY